MNLEESQAQVLGGSLLNQVEANFVAHLACEVRTQLNQHENLRNASIGVLTFYNRQRSAISKALGKNESEMRISVKSVDAFQVRID